VMGLASEPQPEREATIPAAMEMGTVRSMAPVMTRLIGTMIERAVDAGARRFHTGTGRSQSMKALDPQFILRVYRTSGWVTALAALVCGSRWGTAAALGLAAGCVLSLCSLWVIASGVRRLIRPGVTDYRPLVLYGLASYPALLLGLWAIVESRVFNLPAVAAGVALPHLVIVLKIAGRNLVARSGCEGN
ncbi:MAG: hypothetical protein LC772_10235, partial [Chloroflexi bacterium]|nr:hypothetical protein [Chloroflexota bacterium]